MFVSQISNPLLTFQSWMETLLLAASGTRDIEEGPGRPLGRPGKLDNLIPVSVLQSLGGD